MLVFFTDQQRHDSTGVHHNPLDLTPNFDELARRGTDVHYSFTCAPVCGPARACLQTGTYITRNGVTRNGPGLPDELPTLAERFNDAGYRSSYFGKWHLSQEKGMGRGKVPPENRGGYRDWLAANALEGTSDAYRTRLWNTDSEPVDLPGYRVDALADRMIDYLDRHFREGSAGESSGGPFFMFSSFIEPHHQNHVDDYPPPLGYRPRYRGQWVPPDLAALPAWPYSGHDLSLRNRLSGGTAHHHLAGYWGMVKRLDEALGRIVDALHSLGQLENTIILFTSDHACHFRTRNSEYKRSGHDSSIRVPTMLHGGPFTGGGRLQQMVSLVDLPPTLLDACGIDVPETMQGRSLLQLLRGGGEAAAQWPDSALVHVCDGHMGLALRTRRWKYILADAHPDDGQAKETGIATAYRETELYDLQHDPYELHNLIEKDSHTKVREVMRDRLRQRLEAIGDHLPQVHEPQIKGGGQRVVTDAEARM